MDFTYDDEQQALREAVRGLLATTYADHETRRRTVAEQPGFDQALWGRLAEMGILGLPFRRGPTAASAPAPSRSASSARSWAARSHRSPTSRAWSTRVGWSPPSAPPSRSPTCSAG